MPVRVPAGVFAAVCVDISLSCCYTYFELFNFKLPVAFLSCVCAHACVCVQFVLIFPTL